MTFAKRERRALADTLAQAGPGADTLCEGWTTHDLAIHLVLRESRADAGLVLAADEVQTLRPYAQRVTRRVGARSYEELVTAFRSGPPLFSAFSLPGVEELANTIEFFVHHEDVRRARPVWQPRELSAADENVLWEALHRYAALAFLRAPVAAVLRVPNGPRLRVGMGKHTVVITGRVGELVMTAAGRSAAVVEVDGPDPAREAYHAWRR